MKIQSISTLITPILFAAAIILTACGGQTDDEETRTVEDPEAAQEATEAVQGEAAAPPAEATAVLETPPAASAAEAEAETTRTEAETSDCPDDEKQGSDAKPTETTVDETTEAREPEEVIVEAADGLPLYGTYFPAADEGHNPGLLLLHMNGGRRQDWQDVAATFAENGYGVLTLDMRGHGETGSSKDWEKAADDIQRAWRYLVDRDDIDPERTAIVGASIGANMALVTGMAEPAVLAAVLLSPGLDYFGVTTDDAVAAYGDRPLLIVASEEDAYAADSSRTLKELAQGEAELILYSGAGHGTRMFDAEPELVGSMLEFLGNHLETNSAEAEEPAAARFALPETFSASWDDRSMFRDGLIDSETAVLDELSRASLYRLVLDFAPEDSVLGGQQQVRYTNQEEVGLDSIFLHLHANRLGGELSVSEVSVNGEAVEPAFSRFDTVMEVPLRETLAPGERVILDMSFDLDIPGSTGPNFGLLSASENEAALAHFYPQIAVFDEEGWNVEIPAGVPDITYGDSAYYLVNVTAPADQLILTSGLEINSETNGGRQSSTFAAGPVRDFYIISSDRYETFTQQVGEISVNSYSLPGHQAGGQSALEAAVRSLELFNERIGPYPFTELDVVSLPSLSNGPALGIEYPGIVVINSDLYESGKQAGRDGTPTEVLLEATTAHEIGHQWFYSTVGNDQINDPWLDESLVQYITYRYYVDTYGSQAAEGFRQSLVDRWGRIAFEDIVIGLPVSSYTPTTYGAIVYGRGPLFFEALAQEIGQEQFDAFLADYYQQNKWGNASGVELKSLVEEHCDCDLTPLFAEWVFGT